MKLLWTAFAILAAFLLESALSRLAPNQARILDPFLLVAVYCALHGGEVHGMLAGAAAGWIQEVHFGGQTVVGLSGLAKVIVGFGVGLTAGRFLIVGPGPRFLVIFVATLVDALIYQGLASGFDIPAYELSLARLLARAGVNALIGAALYELIDRRSRAEARS